MRYEIFCYFTGLDLFKHYIVIIMFFQDYKIQISIMRNNYFQTNEYHPTTSQL